MLLTSKKEISRKLNPLLANEDIVSVDLETTGLWAWRGDDILSVQFYLPNAKQSFTIMVCEGDTLFSVPTVELEWVDWDEINKCRILMHNAKFDMTFLDAANICIDEHRVFDTMHAQFLLHNMAQSKALKTLTSDIESNSQEWLDYAPEGLDLDLARETASKRANLASVDIEALVAYAETDVVLTYILYRRQMEENTHMAESKPTPPLSFMGREMILNRVVMDMEKRGIKWNAKVHSALKAEMESELIRMRQELGFDPMSSNVLRNVFGTTEYDKATLLASGNPKAPLTVAYRELQHDYGTFVMKVAECVSKDGFLHGNFRQNGTNTGRFSSSKPNMLGIPKRMRKQFSPPKGKQYLCCDLAQIELAVGAWYADCTPLLEVFAAGGDPHQATADLMGIDRNTGKRVNFSMVYGISANSLSERMGISSAQAQTYIRGFRNAYPELGVCKVRCESAARRKGELKIYNGATREVPETYKAWSYLIQSAVGELAKDIMIDLWLYMQKIGGHLVLHVHDEFVLEIPDDAGDEVKEEIYRIITSAGPKGMVYKTDMEPWKKG